MVWYTRV